MFQKIGGHPFDAANPAVAAAEIVKPALRGCAIAVAAELPG